MPGGYLILHLVDKLQFDPILPAANPLLVVSPQRYAKQRINSSKITFDDFKYQSEFNVINEQLSTFNDKFHFPNGKTRVHEHQLFMEDHQTILNNAIECGFLLSGQIDMIHCAYEYQYIYILTKNKY